MVATVTQWLDDGEAELNVAGRLRHEGIDPQRRAAVIDAGVARRRARARWPDADRLLFTREALEQASDPEVSEWRAERFVGASAVVDLCAGVGGDALALAARGPRVVAVDLDPGRLVLLEHNALARGQDIELAWVDATSVERPSGAWVHADPSRRDGDGRRRHHLSEYLPPVGSLLARNADAPGLGLVLSPAVDLEDPVLPATGELEFIQLGRGLAEAVLWLRAAREPTVVASATLLPSGVRLTRTGPEQPLASGPVGACLVEVVPAAVRARLHDEIGRAISARRIAARRALLTCDDLPPADQWYERRAVETVLPVREKVIRRWLRTADELPLEIATHGLDADPRAWWRGLGRPPRGPRGRRLDLIRTDDTALAVLSRQLGDPTH